MGFQLTIAEGKEAGREFVFEQASVVIGRTSECDVVLYDPGVSRKHARIFSEDDGYFVEDMGSSNGTKLNGEIVKKAKLNDGDAVTLGPVVFNFSASELMPDEPGAPAEDGANSTRIVSVDAMKKQRNKGSALAPEGAGKDQLQSMTRSKTQTLQAISKPRVSNPKVPVKGGAQPAAPLARGSGPKPAAAPVRGGGANSGLSAAERARLKRDTSLGGKARLFWADASPGKRKGVIGGAIGMGLLALGAVVYVLVVDPNKGPPKIEPNQLSRMPVEESFGLGTEGNPVDFERADQKSFTFEVNSPSQVVVLVHFQCADISQNEVRIQANGFDIGSAPADQLGSGERAHELILPPKAIKRGEVNRIVFDNAKNPPGEDPWRIWNVWIEVAGVPTGNPEDLLRQAQTAFRRGQQNLDRKDIGAANRYEAWRDFRAAWLTLEGHPDPKPDLYNYARDKMKESQDELDRKCSQLMLEFEGYVSQYNWPSARSTLEHVKEYYPGNDQPCRWKAEVKREEWGL